MAPKPDSAIVRVYHHEGKYPVGAGFYIGDKRILTCAHVVNTALGKGKAERKKPRPSEQVTIDFPFLPPTTKKPTFCAHVVKWSEYERDDVARLIIAEADEIPEGVDVLEVKTPQKYHGEKVTACGFASRFRDGRWAEGSLSGPQANGRIQIDGASNFNYAVEQGFSGSVVWSHKLNAVLGLLTSVDMSEDVKQSFMIPANILSRYMPPEDASVGSVAWKLKVWICSDLFLSLLDDLVRWERDGLGKYCMELRQVLGEVVNAVENADAKDTFLQSYILPELEEVEEQYIEWNSHEDKQVPNASRERKKSIDKLRDSRRRLSCKAKKHIGVLERELDYMFFAKVYQSFKELCEKYPQIFVKLDKSVRTFEKSMR